MILGLSPALWYTEGERKMYMRSGIECLICQVGRQAEILEKAGEGDKKAYYQEVLRLYADAPDGLPVACLIPDCDRLYERYFPKPQPYREIKRRSNEFLLERLPPLRTQVVAAEDGLLAALRYARVGNYIDFGVLNAKVAPEKLEKLLEEAQNAPVDAAEYEAFLRDVAGARKLVYLMDNAGEIVLDGLLLEQLKTRFPDLSLVAVVRGRDVVNDATLSDAEAAGIGRYAKVVTNGSGIPGTYLPMAPDELRREIETADVILSKGQGNFETMYGCGLNVYYLFLCKCGWFRSLFGVPEMTGMFVNERRVKLQ